MYSTRESRVFVRKENHFSLSNTEAPPTLRLLMRIDRIDRLIATVCLASNAVIVTPFLSVEAASTLVKPSPQLSFALRITEIAARYLVVPTRLVIPNRFIIFMYRGMHDVTR